MAVKNDYDWELYNRERGYGQLVVDIRLVDSLGFDTLEMG